jgi:hypothetical protein
MVVNDVNLIHESMETKIWHAETDRGPREVAWSHGIGWSIKQLDAPSSPESLLTPCSTCEAPIPAGQFGKCHWCGRTGLCSGCLSRAGHFCEGTAST